MTRREYYEKCVAAGVPLMVRTQRKNADGSRSKAPLWPSEVTPGVRAQDPIPEKYTAGIAAWFDFEDYGVRCQNYCEVIDFDHDADRIFPLWWSRLLKENGELAKRLYVEKSPHGYHVVYRPPVFEGSQKLAMENPATVRIETRGNGGWTVLAPSEGYSVLQGALYDLPRVTKSERDTLIRLAREFHIGAPMYAPTPKKSYTAAEVKPEDLEGWELVNPLLRWGAGFTLEQWKTLLLEDDWKELYTDAEGRIFWQRPGKSRFEQDFSGDLYQHNGCWFLKIFSTNAGLPTAHGITAMSYLQHRDDYTTWQEAAAENITDTPRLMGLDAFLESLN